MPPMYLRRSRRTPGLLLGRMRTCTAAPRLGWPMLPATSVLISEQYPRQYRRPCRRCIGGIWEPGLRQEENKKYVLLGLTVISFVQYLWSKTNTFITDTWDTINWRDTTHFDSEDDYRTGCRNVSHCQQLSYSGLRSPGRSNSTYFWNDSRVQTFHK